MYHGPMMKKIGALFVIALLAGCSGANRRDSMLSDINIPPEKAVGAPPVFALPGVPLRSDIEPAAKPEAPAAEPRPEAAAPAPVPEAAVPAPVPAPAALPAAEPAAANPSAGPGDLAFHLAAAQKYAARKKYRSAAAEYAAAAPFLPAGDQRAVFLLERQGAMLLRAGDEARAGENFQAAIDKAGELGVSGNDLANAYLGLGYCKEKAKKVPEAIASYEKAMELSPSAKIKARIADTIGALKKNP